MTTALLVLDMLTDFTTGKLANPAGSRSFSPSPRWPARPATATTGSSSTATTPTSPATSNLPCSENTPWPAPPSGRHR